MPKQRGFQANPKKLNKEILLINTVKWSIIGFILLSLASFFYTANQVIYADKINFLEKIFSGNLQTFYNNNFPASIVKLVLDYKQWKNTLKQDKSQLILALNKADIILQILWLGPYKKNFENIKQLILSNFSEISKLLWEKGPKTYLIIFENTSEQRADWGFFWSFAKITFSGWHIRNFQIFDSYYLLRKYCKDHTPNLPKKIGFKLVIKADLI